MTIRADRDPRFYFRFIFIGVTIVGMALWFLYDGLITYPKQYERAAKYEELKEAKKLEDWPTIARENGWPTDIPKNKTDSQGQFILASVCIVLGLWCFFIVWRSRGRWIEATKTGITSSWGQSLDFANVESLDKKKWAKKGIAKVTYTDGNRRRRFVIDDFKFKREATDEILRELENHLTPEQITGGPPEGAEEVQGHDDEPPAAS